MKKMYALAVMALTAVAAQAQYTSSPYVQNVADGSDATIYDVVIMSDEAQGMLKAAGKTINLIAPNDDTRFMYIWDDTFVGGDGSYPGAGWNEETPNFEGYCCVNVSNIGWSGAGYYIFAESGVDLSHLNDNSRFHVAYRSTNAPASVGLILMNADKDGKPANVAVGDPFNDNGNIFPAIGPKATDEWQGVDISIADLKKLCPTFNLAPVAMKNYQGNIVAFLGGGVEGTNISFDNMYFYSNNGSGVKAAQADANVVFTGRTINVSGARQIELFNLQGQLVKNVNGSVMGVEGLEPGLYIARAGRATAKIFVK